MKKSLLAVAAIGAFASAAQAQSSVTVYGIIDAGYVGSNTRNTTNTAVTKTNSSGFAGTGAEQTSRIGFKGNEDLGGGMSAFFTSEFNLIPEATYGSLMINRQTFVGVKKNGIGAASVGLQYTPIFNAGAGTDPGQYNGTIGNVIYVSNNNYANPTAYGATPGAFNTLESNTNATGSYTNSMQNAVVLKSDKFAGFGAEVMYSQYNKTATQTGATVGGTANNTLWGLGANYTWSKLLVTAGYQVLKNETTAMPTTSIAANVGSNSTTVWSAGIPATNVTDNQALVGATYDFGILKAYGQWINRKVTANLDSSYYAKRQAQQIGVRSYITPKVEAWASVGNGRITTFGSGSPTLNFTGYQLGSNYYLSKRTNLYAIFGAMGTSHATTYATGAGSNGNQYALGVRHTF